MEDDTITYIVKDQIYRGTFVQPQTPIRAGVVLLPDWQGQSDLARNHAAHLLGTGCAVMTADLYGDGFTPTHADQVAELVGALIADRDSSVMALSSCVHALRERLPEGVPVFCLGFSAGGMIALDYARSGAEVAGIILCSALLKTAPSTLSTKVRSPVLILQGTQDQVSPMGTIADVIAELDGLGADVQTTLYNRTHHAFDNPVAGDDPTARLCYSAASAKRANAAITQFIDDRI